MKLTWHKKGLTWYTPEGYLMVHKQLRQPSLKGHFEIDKERCKGCSLCIEFCPKKCIILSNELNLKGYFVAAYNDSSECTGCGTCAVICPDVAIEVEKR